MHVEIKLVGLPGKQLKNVVFEDYYDLEASDTFVLNCNVSFIVDPLRVKMCVYDEKGQLKECHVSTREE